MHRSIRLIIFTSFLASLVSGCGDSYRGQPADLVIKNAKVVTIDKDNPRAEAVAMKGEWIIAVTSNRNIAGYIEEGVTRVIDAEGRLVIPGFNDAHCHFGGMNPDNVELRYVSDPNVITQRVKEQVAKSKPGQIIRGSHWNQELFPGEKWPTKELLDPVSPNNPVVLTRVDGHSSLVNSYVIRHSGITKDTPDPFGGEILRDPDTGEPTGVFKEAARRLLDYGAVEVTMTPEEREQRRLLEWQTAFDHAALLGVTSVQLPPGGGPEMYQRFKDMDKLTLRVYFGGRLTDNEAQLKEYDKLRTQYRREENWIRWGYLKFFCDGTLGSATMLMFEPFEPGYSDQQGTGLAMMPFEEMETKILVADRKKFQIGVHAIGDRGVNWVLNAYETAQRVNGTRDSRHRIEHVQFIKDFDIPRFAELGVIPSMQIVAVMVEKSLAEKRIGMERCKNAYAWRKLLDAGARIANGTDYSVEPLDPFEGLYAGVTRKVRRGEPGNGWFPDQKLTMEEVIELYTLGSAYAEFMENRKGMVREGYLGDMIIVNSDLMTIPPDQIMPSKVDYTIVGGRVVFERADAN